MRQAPKVPSFISKPLRWLTGQPGNYTVTEDDRLRVDATLSGGLQGSLTNPGTATASNAAVASGLSANLDSPALVVGKLYGVTVGGSVAFKWEIVTDDVGGVIVRDVLFTGPHESKQWISPHPDFVKLNAGNYRVVATNLDQFEPASAYATFYWDETA